MSNIAWEITEDDVMNVLRAHGIRADDPRVASAQEIADVEADTITEGLLSYADMDDQTASMLSDLETAFREAGILGDRVRFPQPD